MNSLTYENWKQSVAEAKSRGWKLTNCYFLPKALQLKIDAGVLSLRWIENGLILLEDAGSFYRCYYYLSPDDRPGRLELDRDGVVEFPFTGEMNIRQFDQTAVQQTCTYNILILAQVFRVHLCQSHGLIYQFALVRSTNQMCYIAEAL